MWVKGLWVNKEVLEKAGVKIEDLETIDGYEKPWSRY